MRNPGTTSWFLTCVLAVLASGPAMAQSLASDAARPEVPDNQFVPPPCTGTVFTDVTCTTTFDAWIEQLAADQITGGCGGSAYCPTSNVTRAQMAVFLEKAMRGTAFWSPGDLGGANTGLGLGALVNNTLAGRNTAIGYFALHAQSFDNGGVGWITNNTAVGDSALYYNQPTSAANGRDNTAVGKSCLLNTTIGYNDTAVGSSSLGSNTIGFLNTAVGWHSGARADVITGYAGSPVPLVENQTGNFNTFLGITGATAQVDNCTAVGMDAYCDATNQVRLGNVFVTSIGGKVTWSALSDARAKSDIHDLDLGLPFVLALRPVSYRYRGGNGRTDMGFVGQDVEALLGDQYNVLDVGGDTERTLSLRYAELIAPLVKAVQQQQAEIEAQTKTIGQQAREIDMFKAKLAEIDELRAQVGALLSGRELGARVDAP